MSEGTPAKARPVGAFALHTVLALVVGGAALFVALLWMIGAGITAPGTNDGGAHGAGKGLNGYAGLARLLEAGGYQVTLERSASGLTRPGLLILTPPADASGQAIEKIVDAHRRVGPVLVVLPKWVAGPIPADTPGTQKGWVTLNGAAPVNWPGFRDDIRLSDKPIKRLAGQPDWTGGGVSGVLPVVQVVQSGAGKALGPLVVAPSDGRVLADFTRDGAYPGLEGLALDHTAPGVADAASPPFPLVQVYEPDLLDNYGIANAANAQLGEALVAATGAMKGGSVAFDLTLNGFARTPNMLTLVFTPPYLAATLCLLLAALAAGWRAFARFGPAHVEARSIGFGKGALVANAAGLIRRSRRLHLLPGPYVAAARERLARALALPRGSSHAQSDAAIDRALVRRAAPGATPDSFTARAAALESARGGPQMIAAAQDLHALERMLTR